MTLEMSLVSGFLSASAQVGLAIDRLRDSMSVTVTARWNRTTIAADAMQITVDVPAALGDQSSTELAARARLLLVVDEVRAERLTRSAAARALGLTLDQFLIEAGSHGLLAIDYGVEDFRRELQEIPPAAR